MSDLTDEERIRDLEEKQKVLRGHLMFSPVAPKPDQRRPVQPEAGPLDTTEVDALLPDREHLRALNRTVDALAYHVRSLLEERAAREGRPDPLVSDKRERLPTIYRPPRPKKLELPTISPAVSAVIVVGMLGTACASFLPFVLLRWFLG